MTESDILRGALVDWISSMVLVVGSAFLIAVLA